MAKIDHRSPLAPARFPDLPPVAGARFATLAAGIRYQDRFRRGTDGAWRFARRELIVDWEQELPLSG